MTKKACVFLAPGAEEMEYVVPTDILIRGGIEVTGVGVPNSSLVKCSRGVLIKPNIGINEIKSKGPFDVIVLPGGLGGAKMLSASEEVGAVLKEQELSDRFIAAICAGPTVLTAHGIGSGKCVTCHPNAKDKLINSGYVYKEDKVVIDGKLITSQGPGTVFEFALAVLAEVGGKEVASDVANAIVFTSYH